MKMRLRSSSLQTDNTPAQRTVLRFAGFSLRDGKKYRDKVDISAKHNREALNWLARYQRKFTKALSAFRSW